MILRAIARCVYTAVLVVLLVLEPVLEWLEAKALSIIEKGRKK